MTSQQDKRAGECPRCKGDWRPILSSGIGIKPCGLVGDGIIMPDDIEIADCPMSEKQNGYLQALKDSTQSARIQELEGKLERAREFAKEIADQMCPYGEGGCNSWELSDKAKVHQKELGD